MAKPAQCFNCGHVAPIIWVHGHGQCAHCKMNVAPCCDGATAEGCGLSNPAAPPPHQRVPGGPNAVQCSERS